MEKMALQEEGAATQSLQSVLMIVLLSFNVCHSHLNVKSIRNECVLFWVAHSRCSTNAC